MMRRLLSFTVIALLAGGMGYALYQGSTQGRWRDAHRYWQDRTALAAMEGLQDIEPAAGPALLHSRAQCQTPLQRVRLEGATQLDGKTLGRQLSPAKAAPLTVAGGMALLRQVGRAYAQQGLPQPSLKLDLQDLCYGDAIVVVQESPPPKPAQPTLLSPVPMAAGDYAPRYADLPSQTLAGIPPSLLLPPPAETEIATTQLEVAPLQAPQGGWADGTADTTAAPLADADMVTRGEEDLLLLSLTVNGTLVHEGVTAYMADETGQVWLPLGLIARVLDFPLKVDTGAGVISGWFMEEANTLSLNTAARTLSIGGKVLEPYPAERIERHADDIYIHSALMAKLMGIDGTLDFNNLSYALTTRQPLPVELRKQREASWAALERQRTRALANALDGATPLPYDWIGMPSVRLDAGINSRREAGGGPRNSANMSVQAQGDILKTSGNLTLSASKDEDGKVALKGASLVLERQELSPTLLGPLQATTVKAGDIDSARLPLADVGARGRGLRINNQPAGVVDDPDRFVITGDAPVGWDVEVYQDQALLAFQRTGDDGRYRFDALPLKSGLNLFRIVQHGPHGEVRESTQRYFLGEGMVAKGQFLYDVSLYQPGAPLIATAGRGGTDTPWMLANRFDYGLSRYLTASLGSYGLLKSSAPAGTDNHSGLTAGLRASYGRVFAAADAMRRNDGATAQGISLRGGLGAGTDVRLGYTRYGGYSLQEQPTLDLYDMSFSHGTTLGGWGITNDFSYTQERQTSQRRHSASHRLALGYGRLAFSHSLSREWTATGSQWTGSLEFSGAAEPFNLTWRGSLAYRPDSEDIFQRALLAANLRLADDVALESTLLHLPLEGRSELANTLRYDWGAFSTGVQARADTQGNMGLGVNLSTQFIPTEGWAYRNVHPGYGSGLGRLLVRVFVDSTPNGHYDDGEKLLPGVVVRNRTRGSDHTVDAQGFAVVDNLTAGTATRIGLEEETIPDIYLKPKQSEIKVVSHPGAKGMVDFPLELYGEITGSLFCQTGDVVRPVGSLVVELVNENGEAIDYAVAESDGYFALGPIPLGRYTLRARESEARVAGYEGIPSEVIALTATDNIRDDVAVALKQVALPEESPPMPASPPQGINITY
ncbi:MAG: hypothetical protein H6922_06410 [Pseudomonadaceae bacterium]|nr:hypothetical protein [Pseudomonadaceae bacterium]